MTGTRHVDQVAEYFSITASTPGFWRPIEFSIPPGVSVTRGVGLPIRGRTVVPLQQIAPSRWTSTTSPYSIPYPNVPDATRIGFSRTSPRPRSTDRSTAASRPSGPAGDEPAVEPPAARLEPFDREEAGDAAADGTTTGALRVAGAIAGLILRTVGRRLPVASRVGFFPPEVTTRRFAFTSPPPSRARSRRRPGPRGRPAGACPSCP